VASRVVRTDIRNATMANRSMLRRSRRIPVRNFVSMML
jgi:hypothetical protein